ncbi:hypothetical protein XM38_008350 [Halomicronema hongdechloris C2206]|uniref:Uncharacterized protein n=1 Tax=Halomicronema hongdechloris C2206 TaxID=1641165 RepID=A0A1Z3HHY3_9CYAN|nr:hypothetical protein [Halomicronema hongdechloris]ASC69905.1 hypothetical protein XM38_008350 [Halomicronema hongdechloris C2206]
MLRLENLCKAYGGRLVLQNSQLGTELGLRLPQALPVVKLLACFEGLPIDFIARQPMRLEQVYREITHPDDANV